MLALPESFQTHLTSGVTTLATAWRLLRKDGLVLGFTDHDRPLIFQGTQFQPRTGLTGRASSAGADLGVDNTEIAGILDSDFISSQDIRAGRFDGARVEIWRVNWQQPESHVLVSSGVLGEITQTETGFSAELRGLSHQLEQTVGRLYQRGCDAVVGDGRCRVDLDQPGFRGEGTIVSIIDRHQFIADGLSSFSDDWFAHGALVWLSGDNQGVSGFVKSHGQSGADTSLSLWQPAPLDLSVGDRFRVSAGCDRRFETCTEKFDNAINFRGFHLMPGNDFVIQIPRRDEDNDGGRR